MKDITDHSVHTKAHQLALGEYLKYIKNQHYKSYMSHIVVTIVFEVSNMLIIDFSVIVNQMFLMNRKQFVIYLEKRVLDLRLAHTQNVRALVSQGLVNDTFSRKYLTWIEFVYETTSKRVKDLSVRPNNFHIFKGFFFIIQDFINLYIEMVPSVINSINGETKRDIESEYKECVK